MILFVGNNSGILLLDLITEIFGGFIRICSVTIGKIANMIINIEHVL